MDLSRSFPLLTENGVEKLKTRSVILFGVGGVGSYVFEALVRAGVGEITVVDFDKVVPSNLNRQLIATTDTIGEYKAICAKQRGELINPEAKIIAKTEKYELSSEYDFSKYDFVIDCIDGLKEKAKLIISAHKQQIPIISATGMGNRLDNTKIILTDLFKTQNCPLARGLRIALRKEEILSHPVVASTELPIKNPNFISSVSYVPGTAGLIMAGYVIRQLIK